MILPRQRLLLASNPNRNLLYDDFQGPSLNTGKWSPTDTEALLAAGRNKAATFNGSTQYLSRASEAALQAGDIDFSWAGWVLLDRTDTNYFIVAKDSAIAGEREYLLAYSGSFTFSVFASVDIEAKVTATTFGVATAYTWYFVMCRYNAAANTVTISVNDGAVDTASFVGPLQAASSAGLGIANRGTSGTFLLSGRVASLGYWKRLLTAAEITWLYNQGYGRVYADLAGDYLTSLSAWWNLTEASGNRASSEGSALTLTDTGSTLWANGPTLSGVPGLVCSGGKATPGWGDPGIVNGGRIVSRRAGLTLRATITPSQTNQYCGQSGFNISATTDGLKAVGIQFDNAGYVGIQDRDGAAAGRVSPLAYSAGTAYVLMTQLLATGARMYMSSDGGVTYQIVGSTGTGTTGRLYPACLNYNGAYTVIPFDVRRRPVKPALYASSTPVSVTPTLEAEIFTDPGLEGNYTAGKNDNLVIDSGTPTLAQSADAHGGSKAQQFTATALFDRLKQAYTVVAGRWYQASIWAKRTAGAGSLVYGRVYDGVTLIDLATYNDAAYTEKLAVVRQASGTSQIFRVAQCNASSGFETVVIDDPSVKALAFSTCFSAKLCDAPAANSNIRFTVPTLTSRTQAGIAVKYANSDNCVVVFHDGTNASVIQYVAGTYSLLAGPTAATYGATTEFQLTWVSSNQLRVYYGSTAIGALLTIHDAIKAETGVAIFSTYASNAVTLVEVNGPLP